MSLLMQALKKAERAKQSHLHDDELVKPSDELDQGLSLQPQAPTPALSLEPTDEPTLAPAFRPAAPLAEYGGAGLSLTPLGEEPPTLTDSLPPPPATPSAPSPSAQQAEPARPQAAGQARAKPRTAPPPKSRPAAPAKASPWSSLSPETIRLGILGGIALLILCIFAYIYWRAVNAPGAGSNLPMVAMPPQQLSPVPGGPGGLGQGVVVAPPADAVAPGAGLASTAPAADLPPRQPSERPSPAYVPESARNPVVRSAPPPELGYTTRERPLSTADLPAEEEPVLREPGRSPGAPEVRASRGQASTTASGDADIRVRRSDNAPRTNPSLQTAYQAFTGGDLPLARQQYSAVLRQEPNNRDALLGSAAVALRDKQPAQAAAQYLRLLELDPNDADAVAGLSGLRQGDPQQLESRLRAVVERAPDAGPALFALGNLYAQQSRWADAQQAYFRAFSSAPDNPDYAFNLAIGLDRLNQGKLALAYYQRALALSTNTPAMFDRAALRRRLHELTVAGGAVPTAAP